MLDDARIFHVNVNCSDLARSRAFYVGACGLAEGVRTTPDVVQSGDAFGLGAARWDAWILVGAAGFDGGAIDLLEWQEPRPTGRVHRPDEPGFARIVVAVAPDVGPARVSDPDGVVVDLVAGPTPGLVAVAVGCADRDRSRAFYGALGFTETEPDPTSPDAVALAAPGGGPVRLVLAPVPAPQTAGAVRPANAVGIWRTALLLTDLDAAVARLRAAGIPLLSAPQAMAMGPGVPDLRFVCFRGPDQEVVELIEAPAGP
jgi:catechol 2,3-dioxygenase-like lactoylglutathione lyase family enzyme